MQQLSGITSAGLEEKKKKRREEKRRNVAAGGLRRGIRERREIRRARK